VPHIAANDDQGATMATPENVEPQAGQSDRLTADRLAYPIDEFASALGVGRSKLYAEIKAGRLKAKKLGSRTLIKATDGQAYLDSLPDMAA
jgi:excisionase family DNA binding protein